MTEDKINHPKHYTKGIECADFIQSHGMDFFQGNAIKYLTRYKLKGSPIEDLQKARWYLDRLIEEQRKCGETIKTTEPEYVKEVSYENFDQIFPPINLAKKKRGRPHKSTFPEWHPLHKSDKVAKKKRGRPAKKK